MLRVKTSDVQPIIETSETSPWLPEGASWEETDFENGVTIKDVNNNEWTWVVVPKSVTSSATTDDAIETALKNYAATLVTDRGSYTDTWYSEAQAGMSSDKYSSKKSAMLNGIKEYGGFWIGKYEAGFTETPTSSNYNTTTRTAVIQRDAYPYNFISCANAESKAELLATQAGGNGSLMFGTQWDLVLKHLVTKGAITSAQATSDSSDWGNYKNKALTIDSSNAKQRSSNTSWPTISKGTTTSSSSSILLTSGAAEGTTGKLNVVDLAGSVTEWTLEYTSYTDVPCAYRGGGCSDSGSNYPSSSRVMYLTTSGYNYNGYRPTMYAPAFTAPETNETSPWLPEGASWEETDFENGVTIKDVNNNEWTWVEVPKSVTASATTDDAIETALKNYVATLVTDRGSYTDTWYSEAQAGMSSDKYSSKKSAMLNGIKEYGGFWIGKYEAGFTETPTDSNYNSTSRTAVIQRDAYPYNLITCANSEAKAETLATQAGGNGSLMFGTQWDLVLKHLVNKGAITSSQATSNSTDWGNYKNKALTIDSTNAKQRSSNTSWPTISKGTTTSSSSSILLTSGAAEGTTGKMNVVDLAGNVSEWTLEYTSRPGGSCASRGGVYSFNGDALPASLRDFNGTSLSHDILGFRPTLYNP